jgi:two-component system, chemotaxis family, chemotaxis protein CheY
LAYQFKNISVLIVDSQPAIVDLIKGVLQMFGVQKIHACTEGQAGLRAFERYAPDLLIIDWDLDSIDGIDFTKSVRSSTVNPYVPIIFMTAFSSQKRVAEARDSGVTEFLRKPFTAESLYKRIESIVEKPRPFVRASSFFGPDRRRKRDEGFSGEDKRENRATDTTGSNKPPYKKM